MIQRANSSYSKLEAITRQANDHFLNLLASLKNTAQLKDDLRHLRDLVDCVQLENEQLDNTISRINNALRYLESSEQGAAKYEIHQLIRTLHLQLNACEYASPAYRQIDDDPDFASFRKSPPTE